MNVSLWKKQKESNMAFHQERLEKNIATCLAGILREESKNPLLKFVSVTKVAVTKDLGIATIWYTVMGDENEVTATSKALENAKGFLRSELATRIQVRKMPELRFKYDDSIAYGNHIEEILAKINQK